MEVLVNESNLLVGIYFQDVEMKQILSAYPELICIDATYKLLELRFPVYIMLVEDGNGQSEIVAAFLLMEDTEQSIKSMVGIFKNHNPQWEATRVLMADKDMTERNVLAAEFPSAELLICLFHTFRSFRREVAFIIFFPQNSAANSYEYSSLRFVPNIRRSTVNKASGIVYTRGELKNFGYLGHTDYSFLPDTYA